MRPESFASDAFGEVRLSAEGFSWFAPRSLPRALSLDAETQLALSQADASLGRLAGVGGMLKRPQVLARPYVVREALASARIEGTHATFADVFTAEAAGRPTHQEVQDVNAHVLALEEGLGLVRGSVLTLDTLRRIHARLMQPRHGKEPGRLRERPVWVGSPTARPETAEFVPPVGETMLRALSDWEDFLARPPRLPTLVRAALLHYQLLTIHPFLDGNGRVGRMFVLLFLYVERRLPVPLLYLSPYFEQRRREYFDRLQAVREQGDVQQWLQFFLTAVEVQAEDGVQRARSLLDLRERYRAELSGSRSRARELADLLFENPFVTTALAREVLGVTHQGALNLIRQLEGRGWLTSLGRSGRGAATTWLARDIFNVIVAGDDGEERDPPADAVALPVAPGR